MNVALVTGAAGFVGSHLCEELLAAGWSVHGLDCFSDHYDGGLKELNVAEASRSPRFALHRRDLARDSLDDLVAEVDVVFHLAARPGVRDSWEDFQDYVDANIVGTRALLDACAGADVRLVYASSSSVYGDAAELPVTEETPLRPVSPYGATKVMSEVLAGAYARSHGIDAVGLRYFTVYGPRQRPDMGLSRFIEAAVSGRPIPVYGDGRQRRDMTYVGDAARATIAAAERAPAGAVFNIASGRTHELLDVLALLGEVLDRELDLRHEPAKLGDVRDTWADVTRAREAFGYAPGTHLRDGLARQVAEAARRREPAAQASA